MAHKKKAHMHKSDESSKERHGLKEPMGKEKGKMSLKSVKDHKMKGK